MRHWISMLFAIVVLALPTVAMGSEGWRLNGSQGVLNLVVIEKEQAKNVDAYRLAVAELCGVKPICQVLFWIEGTNAPRSLPMSDAQVAAQAAHWQFNANTSLRRFLWSCDLFPQTPKDECF